MSKAFEAFRTRLEGKLARKGQRLTPQRNVIAEVLFHDGEHSNVDELYQLVRQREAGVGHATVYRTLKLFQELDLVRANSFVDGTVRYEVAAGGDEHHDHLICKDCGHIVEFENDAIERLQHEVAARHGFRLTDHKMVLYGACTRSPCPNAAASR